MDPRAEADDDDVGGRPAEEEEEGRGEEAPPPPRVPPPSSSSSIMTRRPSSNMIRGGPIVMIVSVGRIGIRRFARAFGSREEGGGTIRVSVGGRRPRVFRRVPASSWPALLLPLAVAPCFSASGRWRWRWAGDRAKMIDRVD